MLNIDIKDIKKYERDLIRFADRAYPFATKNTVNVAAFNTQKLARRDVDVKMVQRNKFTQQSILVEQSKTLRVRDQSATVGSIADYMAVQEFGGTKTKSGKEGVVIPTSYSAGQGIQQPRTRLPRGANKLETIKLRHSKRRRAKTRKQATLFAVQDAVKSNHRTIFLDLGKRKGLFRVVGGSKKFKRGWPKGARLRMLYDMTEQTVTIPRNPWLKPAVDTVSLQIPAIYAKSLAFQLKRLGLFDGT